jgi:hypothetical protein
LPRRCKEEPPAQAGGFLFRTASCAIGWFDSWQARLTLHAQRIASSNPATPTNGFLSTPERRKRSLSRIPHRIPHCKNAGCRAVKLLVTSA